ncbi:MAG: hypothetical protein HC933_20470 [Pleurocapsa sp. SU_196_0]|nr:hypothetical protein [Pleurocapsa sp. SU_196_0]
MKLRNWLIGGALAFGLMACSAEQQNNLGRDVLNLSNTKHYIVVYSINGTEIFRGEVRGKVTRAESGSSPGGEYVYWFDPANGKYWQTNMPYIVTTDENRNGLLTTPTRR